MLVLRPFSPLVTLVTTHPVAEACPPRGRGSWLAWDVQGFLVQLWEESRPSEKAGQASGFGGADAGTAARQEPWSPLTSSVPPPSSP